MRGSSGTHSFPGVSLSESWLTLPAQQDTAVPVFAGFSSRLTPGEMTELSGYEQFEDGEVAGTVLYWAVRHYFDNGGQRCFVLSLGSPELPQSAERAEVLAAMTRPESWEAVVAQPEISLLAVPDCVVLDDDDDGEWLELWHFLLVLAQQCGAHALLDSPSSAASVRKCLDNLNALHSECGSLYWPRLVTTYQSGHSTGKLYTNTGRTGVITLPASAAVAAVIAQVDVTNGIWSAPANVALSQVIRPQHLPREGSVLFRNNAPGINLIRSFPLRGTRVWGCRTLAANVGFDWRQYIQARRTLVYIQQSLKHLCHFSVFEPNSLVTWLKIKGLILSWLHELWQAGGLKGVQEEQAYYVRVGEGETMTAAEIAQGLLIIDIGVALQQPAEFIQLHLQFVVQHGQQEPLHNSSSFRGLA